jgi:hypothetical protein
LSTCLTHHPSVVAENEHSRAATAAKRCHVEITQIEQGQDPPGGRQHLAGLRKLVLDAPITQRYQRRIVNLRLNLRGWH